MIHELRSRRGLGVGLVCLVGCLDPTNMGSDSAQMSDTGFVSDTSDAEGTDDTDDTDDTEVDGQTLYSHNCVSCHGATATGFGMLAYVDTHSDAQVIAQINTGPGAMPAFATVLEQDEKEAIVAYLRTL